MATCSLSSSRSACSNVCTRSWITASLCGGTTLSFTPDRSAVGRTITTVASSSSISYRVLHPVINGTHVSSVMRAMACNAAQRFSSSCPSIHRATASVASTSTSLSATIESSPPLLRLYPRSNFLGNVCKQTGAPSNSLLSPTG
jgi:hypothetical protein